MKYRLYETGHNDTSCLLREVFLNRGVTDYSRYMHLDSTVVLPYSYLDNINEAVELLIKHKYDRINILVDSDPDGYCSAAMMYLYLKEDNPDVDVHYITHDRAKSHGLSDVMDKAKDCKLIIIPDAGTNDVDECKQLHEEYGIDIIILDHHEREVENPYAVIVNNQISDNYLNKEFSGAGIVYKFLQALDDELWNDFADNYLDLLALANISDAMDLRSFETRYLVDKGLRLIKNKAFSGFLNAQSYSLGDKINIHGVQWSITPLMNALIRLGTVEERDLMFRAFIESGETFEYTKRATKDHPATTIMESIYDRVPRLCKNIKSRQDKEREKAAKSIITEVEANGNEDKVIMADVSNIMDVGLTGVVAIRIAKYFNKPCILLRQHWDEAEGMMYGGSARNPENSPVTSFKDVVNQTTVMSGVGHPNAFGCVGLKEENKDKVISELNTLLKDIEYDSTYNVDFILSPEEVTIPLIYEVSQLEDYLCQGISPVLLAVENISLYRKDIYVIGKNQDTISFTVDDIKYIKFRCKQDDPLLSFVNNSWNDEDQIEFTVVGEPSINEYQGVKTCQVAISDVNVISVNQSEISEEISEEELW